MNKKMSSLLFLIIIIMFSFPWVMVSCGGQPVLTSTGFQAMSGSYGGLAGLESSYGGQAPKTHPNFWLIFAFITAIAGIIVGLLRGGKVIEKTLIWLSSLETFFLIMFPIQVMSAVSRGSTGINNFDMGMGSMIQVSFRPAYYITLILSIACIILNAYYLKSERSSPIMPQSSSRPNSDLFASDYIFCPKCGAKNLKSNKFCSNCGAKLE
ncbi:zinc-ribbon domain-containing protein [Caldisericum sp.]|jgi:hypothetical protein|uniref:zinc ribbon domain-containing protein n=1 Tax=Caldisericum sp. TaxID=2499687 RepID=UPI003D0D574C